MASSSTVEGNSCVEVDIRFILKQCDCGELADMKITKSNKNNNRGRIYYSCKRQKCGSFLGWCKISSIEQIPFVIAPPEARELVVVREKVLWKWLTIIAFLLSFCLAMKEIM
ncbi:uncharacterized protein A4U43_C09F2950 [Asparagus officinalis]|uniref:GRF-like zinc ribbon domain-containing protein n=1 Tax=Asparagus officinalis TaxID=4686 RepID=A0A5P1E555_ASPOF|nr:uncharacterized protein A4U43_C09F2950 [Asparagus officinalis]